jgi:hypothetical protein
MESVISTESYKTVEARYPLIAKRLEQLWGDGQLDDYVRSLVHGDHGRFPSMFSEEVIDALRTLLKSRPLNGAPLVQKSVTTTQDAPAPVVTLTDMREFKLVTDRFPRIGTQIANAWETKSLSPYLNDLLRDTREGQRQGFPPEVAKALFKLMLHHDAAFPNLSLNTPDFWVVKE